MKQHYQQDQAEEIICESEGKTFKIIHSEENRAKNEKEWRKPMWSVRYHQKKKMWIIGVPWGEGRETESLFKEIVAENLPNLGSDLDIQIHEAHRSRNKCNIKRSSLEHIIIKLSKNKDKERILKAAREEQGSYKGTPIRLSVDFSAETLARREWDDIFKVLKKKNCQPRIFYVAKLSRNDKDFPRQTNAEGIHH